MPVTDGLFPPGASLEIGTDSEAAHPPYHWFVTASIKSSTATDEVLKQWGPMTEKQARETYKALWPAFSAMASAAKAAAALVGKMPAPTTACDGFRRVYFPPEQREINYPGGIDYGRDIMLLAKEGKLEIWWMKSSQYRHRGYSQTIKTELRLVDRGQFEHGLLKCGQRLGDKGGRLSAKRLAEHADEINDFFGWPISEHLAPGRTVLVSSPEPSSDAA